MRGLVKSLWVRIRGMANKEDVGIYYQSPNQDNSTDELFYRQWGEISVLIVLVLMGFFTFLHVICEYSVNTIMSLLGQVRVEHS